MSTVAAMVLTLLLQASAFDSVRIFAHPSSDDPWLVQVELTAREYSTFLRFGSPLDSAMFACEAFRVKQRNSAHLDNPLRNVGAKAKRSPAKPSDFVTMSAGEIQTVSIDLSHCFVFEENTQYVVSHPSDKSSKHSFLSFRSSTRPHKQSWSYKASNYGSTCTSDEWSETETAITNALAAVDDALYNNLLAGCAGTDYTNFFGEYSQARYYIVRENFRRMFDILTSSDFGVVCNHANCSDGVFAYVYPDDGEHLIYMCQAYFDASVTLEQDSKPGVIIHELSHFDDIAGTSDFQYGYQDNQDMADEDPCKAVWNADSNEYYVEQILDPSGSACCADLSACDEQDYCDSNGTACLELSVLGDSSGEEETFTYYSCVYDGVCSDLTLDDGSTWVDAEGDGCEVYFTNGYCEEYGDDFANQDLTANMVCCGCEAGVDIDGSDDDGSDDDGSDHDDDEFSSAVRASTDVLAYVGMFIFSRLF